MVVHDASRLWKVFKIITSIVGKEKMFFMMNCSDEVKILSAPQLVSQANTSDYEQSDDHSIL